MNRILIVESDFTLSEKLYRAFSSIETEVTSCATMESATAILEDQIYNVAIIDTQLNDGDGYDLIYEIGLGIYKSKDVSIIAIMPNNKRPDYIEILERGITDYVTRPFSTAVLKAKIYTIFTRKKKAHAVFSGIRSDAKSMENVVNVCDRKKVVIDNYVFDFEMGEYSVGGRKVVLDDVQEHILYTLINNRGIVLKKRALVDRLRDQSRLAFIDDEVLAEMVSELVNELCAENYIKTVYGIGYMWIKLDENNVTF
jgi:DNA-binding response OmpR family regulator